jgi:hypothetical protein
MVFGLTEYCLMVSGARAPAEASFWSDEKMILV